MQEYIVKYYLQLLRWNKFASGREHRTSRSRNLKDARQDRFEAVVYSLRALRLDHFSNQQLSPVLRNTH